MQEQPKIQQIPVKMYRTSDRLMVAAPMPGLQPDDILVEVTAGGHLIMQGQLRGLLKDVKELLLDEWSVGSYYRDLTLPDMVDGEQTNVTYANGIVVVAMVVSDVTRPATLRMEKVGPAHGERIGNVGQPS